MSNYLCYIILNASYFDVGLFIFQDKFANVMKDNANLHEKLKDVEYQNVLLEGETDTIGKDNFLVI